MYLIQFTLLLKSLQEIDQKLHTGFSKTAKRISFYNFPYYVMLTKENEIVEGHYKHCFNSTRIGQNPAYINKRGPPRPVSNISTDVLLPSSGQHIISTILPFVLFGFVKSEVWRIPVDSY